MAHENGDRWRRYWAEASDGSRRRQVELAAADPLNRWLVADVPSLLDEPVELDPAALRSNPDAVLSAAREGFAAFVADGDVSGHDDPRYDYEDLSIHLTTLGRVDGVEFALADPFEAANALSRIENAAVVEAPTRRHEAAVLTYECPRGHETTVRAPRFRSWSLETCPTADCSAPVVPDDARTRVRSVVEFVVETPAGRLPCVATGRPASDDAFERLADASRLHLTGIARLVAETDGGVQPHYEVLAVEATGR